MPASDEIYLSIIVPAYNEEAVIENALRRITEFLNSQGYDWEVIVVDDASIDSTVIRIEHFLAEHTDMNVKLLVHDWNQQKGAAIRRGIFEVKGKYVLSMDADYAYPVNQIGNFLNHLEQGIPVVIGNRADPATTFLVKPSRFPSIYQRYLLGRVFNLLVRFFLLHGIKDTQCGIKAMRTETARSLIEKMTITNFAFDVELLYIARQNGNEIIQIPVTYDYIDEPSSLRLFRDSLVMFKSLLQIRLNGWMKRYALNTERRNSG